MMHQAHPRLTARTEADKVPVDIILHSSLKHDSGPKICKFSILMKYS